jgi:Tfp pilus assembly protein PilV
MKMRRKEAGVGIIEVLIGLFILAFGLITLAMFSNKLFQDSASSKARLEAMHLAQEKLEDARHVASKGDISNLLSLAENAFEIKGQNTTFYRTASAASTADGTIDWTVKVDWTDSQNNAQTVELDTEIVLMDLTSLESLGDGYLPGGGSVKLPVGIAKYGNGETVEFDPDDIKDDGVAVVVGEDGTKYIAVGNDAGEAEVLVKIDNYSATRDFGVIRGAVYIDSASGINLDETDGSFGEITSLIYVRPSDVGVCPWKTDGSGNVVIEATDISTVKRLEYSCYVGADWYGNISLVRLDGADLNGNSNRVCGGDPAAYLDAGEVGLTNHRPQLLLARRKYRGFTAAVYDPVSKVPLIDVDGNRIYLPSGIIGGHVYGYRIEGESPVTIDEDDGYDATQQSHDFTLTRINGLDITDESAAETACNAVMVDIDEADFAGNAGDFVCMYGPNEEFLCPPVIPGTGVAAISAAPYTVTGNIDVVAYAESTDAETVAGHLIMETSQDIRCDLTPAGDAEPLKIGWNCPIYIPQVEVDGIITTGVWSGTIDMSLDAEHGSTKICGTSSLNVVGLTDQNYSSYANGSQFTVSGTDDCGDVTYSLGGVVENISSNKSYSLADDGAMVVFRQDASDQWQECSYNPQNLSAGGSTPFSCTVPDNFSGTVTLTGNSSGSVKGISFSGTGQGQDPVSGDVSGLVITIK